LVKELENNSQWKKLFFMHIIVEVAMRSIFEEEISGNILLNVIMKLDNVLMAKLSVDGNFSL